MGAARQRTFTPTTTWSAAAAGEERLPRVSTWSSEIVQKHNGYWTVHDVETGIFGSGPDADSAREDFERALREHLDVLEGQENLSPELAAQLGYLRQRLS